MSDLMKLTHVDGTIIWINPEVITLVEPREKGSRIILPECDVEVNEDPEKVINERRAAMERQP